MTTAQIERELAELQVALLRDGGCTDTEILDTHARETLTPADEQFQSEVREQYRQSGLSIRNIKALMRRLVLN